MRQTIVVGCDHAGFELKTKLLTRIRQSGHHVIDVGANRILPKDDYPDYAEKLAHVIQSGRATRGILICGSGVGASIAANKFQGIRAALCTETFSAHQGVEDDDANVLCLGARVTGELLAFDIVTTFLKARFSNAPRHRRRVEKLKGFDLRSAIVAIFLSLAPLRSGHTLEQIHLRPNENQITSAVLDAERGLAYFGVSEHTFPYSLEQSSAEIVRIRVTPFSRTGTLWLKAGENPLNGALVSSDAQSAYFGIYGDPNRDISASVVEVDLARLARGRVLTFQKNVYGIHSALKDPSGQFGYFGTLYGTVVSVALKEMAIAGSMGISQRDKAFRCGVIDLQGTYAYFGTGTGDIMKTQLSDFSPVGNLTVLRTEEGFGSAVLEPGGKSALFATRGTPAQVVRIQLNEMKAEPAVELEANEGAILSIFIDPSRGKAYFVSGGDSPQIIAMGLNPLARVKSYQLPAEIGKIKAAVFDVRRRVFLLGCGSTPARIVRWALPD